VVVGLPILIHLWVRTSTDSSQEGFIGDEAVIILRVTALLDQDVNLLTLKLLTKGEQDVLKLAQHHGAILHFVVQLETLNEVLKATSVLGLLHVAVDGEELFESHELLSLLGGATESLDHLQGGVQVQTSETVTKVEQVDPALALEVIDVESELGALKIKTNMLFRPNL
jgi:hypothetical protein